jgi:hypothetical protein
MDEVEALKSEIRERIDLTFLEFVRLTRYFTIPQIRKVVDELIAECQIDNPFPPVPKTRTVWTSAGPMEDPYEPA